MDVDAMTVEKHKDAMRKGLCFSCGKQNISTEIALTRRKLVTWCVG